MSEVGILLQILITVVVASAGARRGGEASNFGVKEIKPPQLTGSSKSPIKSFQNENGRIIDCIDIYKQPAFKNPLLRSHKIQMQPSSIPGNSANRNFHTANMATLETVDCPLGTVPIQRTSQQHARKSRHHFHSADGNAANTPTNPEYHYALITASENSSMLFHGAHAWLNVYNVNVLLDQFSETVMVFEHSNLVREAVQFGWNVDPILYGDYDTHVFSYWTADGYKTTGCFNTQCDGFIQISRTRMIGARIRPVSTYGGQQYVIDSLVVKDPESGNWWVALYERGNYIWLGYWPASLFTGLASHASKVYLGGAVHSPVTEPAPPMGTGRFVPDDHHRTCFIANIKFVNASNILVEPVDTPIKSYADEPDCYEVYYEGDVGFNLHYTVIFGGPGGPGCVH